MHNPFATRCVVQALLCLPMLTPLACAQPFQWTARRGVVTGDLQDPGRIVVYDGMGGPGGVPLGGWHHHTLRRLGVNDGRQLNKDATLKRIEFAVHHAFAWNGKFVVVDLGADWRPASVRVASSPLSNTHDVATVIVCSPDPDASVQPAVLLRAGRSLDFAAWPYADSVRIYRLDLATLEVRRLDIPGGGADELAFVDGRLLARSGTTLRCYDENGKRLWSIPLQKGEILAAGPVGAPARRVITLIGAEKWSSMGGSAEAFAIRDTVTGRKLWEKPLRDAWWVQRVESAGDVVMAKVDTHGSIEYSAGTPHAKWTVWDSAGNEIAAGQALETGELHGGDYYSVGCVVDAATGRVVVGTGTEAVLISDGQVVARLQKLPGKPVFLHQETLVCDTGSKLAAVRLPTRPASQGASP